MTMPNFLIIGAAKAGTTSLYHYLSQHPKIFMSPVKEPMFFALEGEKLDYPGPVHEGFIKSAVTDIETYHFLFKEVTNETAIGEASTLYLYSQRAAECIRHYIPDVKLIAILRDPVDRAYSSYLSLVSEGLEPIMEFAQAVQEEQPRINKGWHWGRYINRGLYYEQLKRYFDTFDQSQIKVYIYEDYKSNPIGIVQDIFSFLAIDNKFVPDTSVKHNKTILPRNKRLHSLLTKPNPIMAVACQLIPVKLRKGISNNAKKWNLSKPKLSIELRKKLVEVYREDILKLQDLIQRDFSKWLE